jgi:molybdopterin molybdotransferase
VGAEASDLGIARDEEAALRAAIERGLAGDVLLISGGVSMGVYDLSGKALRALGAEILFEKVAIKPGRPFTFARCGATLVFGCPGNPVSAYVIFQVFARTALRRMMGFRSPAPSVVRGVLSTPVRQRPGRAGYHQAIARSSGGGYAVEVLPTSGSADFVSCARGNALAIVPADLAALAPGDPVDLILLDDHSDR